MHNQSSGPFVQNVTKGAQFIWATEAEPWFNTSDPANYHWLPQSPYNVWDVAVLDQDGNSLVPDWKCGDAPPSIFVNCSWHGPNGEKGFQMTFPLSASSLSDKTVSPELPPATAGEPDLCDIFKEPCPSSSVNRTCCVLTPGMSDGICCVIGKCIQVPDPFWGHRNACEDPGLPFHRHVTTVRDDSPLPPIRPSRAGIPMSDGGRTL